MEKFRHFMLQDYLYLFDYARVFALGVVKARSPELMLLPSALHGGLAAQASVAVYSVVFVGYALCRVGRALADKRAEDAVSASNDLTPAISDEPEMVS